MMYIYAKKKNLTIYNSVCILSLTDENCSPYEFRNTEASTDEIIEDKVGLDIINSRIAIFGYMPSDFSEEELYILINGKNKVHFYHKKPKYSDFLIFKNFSEQYNDCRLMVNSLERQTPPSKGDFNHRYASNITFLCYATDDLYDTYPPDFFDRPNDRDLARRTIIHYSAMDSKLRIDCLNKNMLTNLWRFCKCTGSALFPNEITESRIEEMMPHEVLRDCCNSLFSVEGDRNRVREFQKLYEYDFG